MSDPERMKKMLIRLSMRGVRLAIDDFGSGYASLSHLKQLPVDVLKIDRSVIQNMGASDDDDAIVRSTVELAHGVGVRVVAEGLESEDTLSKLAALGCDMAQGYCLSRPVPADELTDWLEEASRRVSKPRRRRKRETLTV
jgi:EAL domain-containing protein (putative c-di-GMP-specific phosphodiesterase class I)